VLYRSTELDTLQGDDLSAFAAPGLRTVFDLRTTDERSAQPDQLPDGVQLVFDVLKDSKGAAPARTPSPPMSCSAAATAVTTADLTRSVAKDDQRQRAVSQPCG
jgi:Tyrosine phosphatase family